VTVMENPFAQPHLRLYLADAVPRSVIGAVTPPPICGNGSSQPRDCRACKVVKVATLTTLQNFRGQSWSRSAAFSDVSSRNATSLTSRPFSASFPRPPDPQPLQNKYIGPTFVPAVQQKRITLPAMSHAAPPVHDLGSSIADADARSHDEVLAIRSYARRMSRKTHSPPKLSSPLELACIDGEQMPPLSTGSSIADADARSHDEVLAIRSYARRMSRKTHSSPKLSSPLELACIDGEQTFCLCSHDEYLAQRSIARRSLTRLQNTPKLCSPF
jgi:hypothetical protein